jgi:hypothetical protein
MVARLQRRRYAVYILCVRHRRGGTKLVVSLTLAAFATGGFVRPAAAPEVTSAIPAYVSGHKTFFPDPIMGIRGDATILRIPARA